MIYLTWIIGVIYTYVLFMFIPMYKKRNGESIDSDYYMRALIELIIYIIACIAYMYGYHQIKEFFI